MICARISPPDWPVWRRKPCRWAAVALLLVGSGIAQAGAEQPGVDQAGDPAAGAEPGSWHSHQVEFNYMGFTSHYSCDGLQSKLQWLLRRFGARAGFEVSTWGCDRGYGTPSRFVRASLHFDTLQPAPGPAPASAAGPPAGVTAAAHEAHALSAGHWRLVQLAPHRPYEFDGGDCELIEQFRDQILPFFATRAVQNRVQCVPYQESSGGYSLQADVFAP